MKKIMVITDQITENLDFVNGLARKYEVDMVGYLDLALAKLTKRPREYGLIIQEVSMPATGVFSPEETAQGEKTGVTFFERVIKYIGIPTIFWSWSDEQRFEIADLGEPDGPDTIFVKKDFNEDHLLLAVDAFY